MQCQEMSELFTNHFPAKNSQPANLLLCGSGFLDLSGKQPIYVCRATYVNQNVLEIETISDVSKMKKGFKIEVPLTSLDKRSFLSAQKDC